MDKLFYDADEIKRKCEEEYEDVESQIVYLEDRLKYYYPLIEKCNNQSGLSAELRGRIRLKPQRITGSNHQDYIFPFPGETAESSRDCLIANKITIGSIDFIQKLKL